MKTLKLVIYYWRTLFVAAVILHLSFAPPSEFSKIPTFPNEDKLVHFLMYFGWICIWLYDTELLRLKKKIESKQIIYYAGIIVIIAGGVIEIAQGMFFYPRTASWLDWLADTLGVLAGFALTKWLFKKKPGFLFLNTSDKQL